MVRYLFTLVPHDLLNIFQLMVLTHDKNLCVKLKVLSMTKNKCLLRMNQCDDRMNVAPMLSKFEKHIETKNENSRSNKKERSCKKLFYSRRLIVLR